MLKALKTLGELLTTKSKLSASWLDARLVDHDLISGAWSRLVYRDGRPVETVDRTACALCLLEQFHRHLEHRNIFAVTSLRWRDPRAHLLSGEVWEAARDAGMNALDLHRHGWRKLFGDEIDCSSCVFGQTDPTEYCRCRAVR
ncbi:hypothetical protein AB4305_22365 [Nocardia sp. 2YAB30]